MKKKIFHYFFPTSLLSDSKVHFWVKGSKSVPFGMEIRSEWRNSIKKWVKNAKMCIFSNVFLFFPKNTPKMGKVLLNFNWRRCALKFPII